MYQLKKLKSLLLLLFVAVTAKAQLESGKVYNFVNIANTGKSMVWVSGDQLSIADTDESDNKQLWYVVKNDDDSYSLRNLDNGKYLRSPNATGNARWTTVETADANCKFECVEAGSGYSLRATNSENVQHYMHYSSANGGVNRIVCWSTTEPSQWTINEVTVSAKDLEYMFAIGDKAIYQEVLSTLFTDNSCSELKSPYASYSQSQMQADANYLKLSATLQKMVLKMCTDGTWQENNYDNSKDSWSADYAKKYRVQLYEPYNEPECAAAALGLNAHTNLNNPTGIFANEREVIYVMVEGEIKSGASLYLASYTGNGRLGGYNSGIELSEGLNVIPSNGTGNNYCINYVVHTFDTEGGTKKGNQAKKRKLSDYSDLKIHIEGGYINGYWNKVGDELYAADTNESWEYLEARATQTTVTVLGEYITLQFPLLDEHTVDTDGKMNKGLKSFFNDLVKVEDVIDEWDNVMMWERFLLGVAPKEVTTSEKNVKSPYSESKHVVEYTGEDGDAFAADYGDYYNLHGLSFGIPNSYMYGTWDHCGYNFNTMGSIIGEICTSAGSHWGPGHEIGHQHQGIFNMRGLTEVTNNLFSNVVLWYFGETTSRVNGSQGSLSNVLAAYNAEGSDFFTNNIWAQTHMYYKMFLYYHVLGHNPKFYPRLFEMLRQDPMNIQYEQSGAESLLHFYKKCCYASGEDLTEFFRAYGFFRVMTDRFVGDYSNAVYNQTQEDIDAAIAEVKAWAEANNAKENIALLFINDATGETIKSHKGDNLDFYGESVVCSEMGGYATFEQSITEGAELKYTMSGQNVTMSAGGGVGYAIYNKDGEIIAFSDKKTFAISDECATALMWGETTMKVINADNTTTEVAVVDEVATKYALLGGLIEEVNTNVLQYVDETNATVGYYISGELSELKQVLEEAQEVYDNQTVDSYTAMYAKLSQVYSEVIHNDYNRIAMVPGVYRLKNRNHSDRWMSVNDSKAAVGESGDESSTKQQWTFESAGEEGLYYIKNVSTQLYLGSLVRGNQISANAAKVDAKGYRLTAKGTGIWLVTCQDDNRMSLNWNGNSGKVLGWDGEGDAATQWTLTAVSVDEDAKKFQELSALVKKTKELIDEMAEVTPTQKQTLLQTTSPSSPFYLSTNACHNTLNNASDGQGLAGLLDEDAATYFHSDWYGKVADTHYLQVDMGAYNLSDLAFYYTTRDNGANCPTTIEVWGSTDGTTFNDKLYTFTGLPTDGAKTWESPMLSKAKDYSSLRFMVTTAEGGNKFFVMSRFGFAKCEATVQSMGEEYVDQALTDDALINAYASIHKAQEKIVVGGATLEDLTSLYDELSPKYAALEVIYNKAKSAGYTTIKNQLSALIDETNTLINTCATFKVTTGEPLTLSVTPGDDVNYLTAGPNSTQSEGALSNLIDNDSGTSFTSNWDSQTGNPYLQVQLPDEDKLSKFTFTFTARQGGGAPTPSIIVVSGSNDGQDFTPIATFTKEEHGFPAAASGKQWISPEVTAEAAYKYLRFTVTKSERATSGADAQGGYYHFGISHFGVSTVSETVITLLPAAGGATQEDVLAAYNQKAESQAVYDMATTEAQLQKAIDKLKEQKTALEQAQQLAVKYSVVVVGGNGNGGIVYNSVEYKSGAQFDAAPGLDVSNFEPIVLTGYTDGVITKNGTTITVTYNKVYTVKVTGGKGNGGITYGGKDYADGTTFDAEQGSFSVNDLTVIVPDGYTLKETITLNHETGVINVVFSAIPLVDTEKYYTFECLSSEAHKTERFIRDNGKVINGHSAEGSLFRFEAADDDNGYYIKSYVTDKYINHTTDGSNKVYASGEKNTIWTMAVPSHTLAARTLTVGNNLYLNNNGSDCTDNSCTNLQSLDHTKQGGAPGSGNACSLWTITEGTPLDKSALNTLIGETNTLIESCYTDEEFDYAGSLNVTEELMTATREAVTVAQEKYDSKATIESEYEAALNALQTAKDNLQTAINYANLPVQLTFDANSPVTYKVKINRTSTTVLAYDGEMVAVNDFKAGNKSQGWYFMAADNGKVYIMPYHDKNTTLALSTNDFNEGNSKVKGMPIGTDGYTQEWTISNTNMYDNNKKDGWYNITTVNGGTTWYFSNHGGVGNKMGFYNDPNDSGTLFKFEQADFSKSDAYYTLYNYFHNEVLATGSIEGCAAVGYFSAAVATPYNEAYNNATEVLANTTATDKDYTSAYDALKKANEALVPNMPVEGKFYRFVSAHTKTSDRYQANGTYVYADPADNKMRWNTKSENDATAIWTFTSAPDGSFTVTNLHTGTCIGEFIGSNPSPLREEGGAVSIKPLSGDGQVGLISNGTMMHAQKDYNAIVHWETGASGASAWRIVEVEDMSLVKFAVSISQFEHAGLYLNYPVSIPDDVKAYYLDGSKISIDDKGVGTLNLTKIEDKVIPARTAVILYAPHGNQTVGYDFVYAAAPNDEYDNLFTGSTYQTYREAEENHYYYVFGQNNGEIGLYKNGVKYKYNGGAIEEVTEGATHYKMSANKILFDWSNNTTATMVKSFRFRLGTGGQTTSLEDALMMDNTIIYDLYGRRILEVKTSGLYIVNGEKRYIQVK